MLNEKEILTRLQNGEKADDIAQELADMLNSAAAAYNKEVEEKAAAEEKAAKLKTKKIADMQDILDLLHDFCLEYYCDTNEDVDDLEKIFDSFPAEEVVNIVESTGNAVVELENQLKGVESILDNLSFSGPVVKINTQKQPTSKTVDNTIDSFLKSLGLK